MLVIAVPLARNVANHPPRPSSSALLPTAVPHHSTPHATLPVGIAAFFSLHVMLPSQLLNSSHPKIAQNCSRQVARQRSITRREHMHIRERIMAAWTRPWSPRWSAHQQARRQDAAHCFPVDLHALSILVCPSRLWSNSSRGDRCDPPSRRPTPFTRTVI